MLKMLLFLHLFLLFFFLPPILAFSLNLPSANCIDVICPEQEEIGRLGLLDWREDLLDAENKPLEKCFDCQNCTADGYSVCVQPRHFDRERRQLITNEDHCECAHSGPTILMGMDAKNSTDYHNQDHRPKHVKCKLLAGGNIPQPRVEPEMDLGEGIFRICYSNAFRKLPTPKASNEKEPAEGMKDNPVLVTVSQFWLSDYWQTLRPRHLHLFYVFPVSRSDMCEGKSDVPTAQDLMWINAGKSRDQINKLGMPWVCKANLNILMSGLEEEEVNAESSGEKEKRKQQQGGMKEEEDDDYDYNGADPNLPPEVQIERDVFFGANKVRFYYELKVHPENLLKTEPGGKLKFESRQETIKSDTLDFDLEPEIYGTGMPRSGSSPGGPLMRNASRIDRVNIEEHKNGDKMDLTKEQGTREPIVRPIYGRTGKGGGKSAERGKSKTTTAGTHQAETMGTSHSTPSSSSSISSNGPFRHIQSRPISDSVHQIDQSTVVPAPSANVEGEGEYNEENADEGPTEDVRTLESVTSTSSKLPNSQIAGREDPSEEDWLLLRNVLIISLILLAAFVLLTICYKQGLCCFPARGIANGGQQRNGKTRIQNGKKYSQTGK